MSVVYQTNKKTGVTYAYEATSVWVPELKQPRSKRKYLGRVGPDGQIIPANRRKKTPPDEMPQPNVQPETISEYEKRISQLEQEVQELRSVLQKIQTIIEPYLSK